MTDTDRDHLHDAFSAVYLDLACHGVCRYDPAIVEALWRLFLIDLENGLASLFPELSGRQ